MPIYAYRCAACGAEKDVLQKFSDAPLTVCPVCGAESFHRVLTAPAFQLKGSGWYVTDFRDADKSKKAAASGGGDGAAKAGDAASPGSEGAKADVPKADGAATKAPKTESSKKSGDSASSSGAGTGTGAD